MEVAVTAVGVTGMARPPGSVNTTVGPSVASNPEPVIVMTAPGNAFCGLKEATVMELAGAVIVTDAVPDLVLSWTLVAVTVTGFAAGTAPGAVYRPEEDIVPTVELPPGTPPTLQLTAELGLPVPLTMAEHCEVFPVCTEEGEHDAVTEVTATGGGFSVIVAEAVFVLSVTLVAVSVTVAATLAAIVAGAV